MVRLKGFANLTAEQLADATGASVRTARRWRRTSCAPAPIVKALEICAFGDLGQISPPWDGWRLRDGKLWSPEGAEFTPAEVLAIPLRLQHISALNVRLGEISILQDQLRRVTESAGRTVRLTFHVDVDPLEIERARVTIRESEQCTPSA